MLSCFNKPLTNTLLMTYHKHSKLELILVYPPIHILTSFVQKIIIMHIFCYLMILIVLFNKIHDNYIVRIFAEVLKFYSYWWCQLWLCVHSGLHCSND